MLKCVNSHDVLKLSQQKITTIHTRWKGEINIWLRSSKTYEGKIIKHLEFFWCWWQIYLMSIHLLLALYYSAQIMTEVLQAIAWLCTSCFFTLPTQIHGRCDQVMCLMCHMLTGLRYLGCNTFTCLRYLWCFIFCALPNLGSNLSMALTRGGKTWRPTTMYAFQSDDTIRMCEGLILVIQMTYVVLKSNMRPSHIENMLKCYQWRNVNHA